MCLRGAEDQDRTGDPSLFRGMLYQLSYLGKRQSYYFMNSSFSISRLLPVLLPVPSPVVPEMASRYGWMK